VKTLSDERALELLRAAMRVEQQATPAADLWPRLRKRIDRRAVPSSVSDWMLIAALAVLCLLEPSLARILLLHF
jgi:hypothetical protein